MAMLALDVLVMMARLLSQKKVSVVYNNTNSKLYNAGDHCKAFNGYNNDDSSHFINYISEVECNASSNILIIAIICLVAADQPVLVRDSLLSCCINMSSAYYH